MSRMDHAGMQGTDDAKKGSRPIATCAHGHDSMHDMQSTSATAPVEARSPDYSDGPSYASMQGMDMLHNTSLGMLMVDRIEAFRGSDANEQARDVEDLYGNDVNKLRSRSDGARSGGSVEDADLEAFWNRNTSAFWRSQVGMRHDFDEGPSRT